MSTPRTVTRLSRILGLIPYVLANPGVTVDEISDRFGYSEAELTRDLNTVFVCGLPGYGPGELMEAYIDDNEVVIDSADYFSRAPRLSSIEALGLLASAMALVGAGQGTPALESAIEKLAAVILPEGGETLAIDVASTPPEVDALRTAATDHNLVRIRYRSLSREEETERTVEPWAVFTTLGNWYLTGFCRMVDDTRTFRLDRIKSVEVLSDQFDPPTEIPEPVVGYTPSDDDVTALIDLGPAARWVLEYYPVEVVKEDSEWTRIRFSSTDAELPARLLLRLGGTARLVEGDAVRDRVANMGAEILSLYR